MVRQPCLHLRERIYRPRGDGSAGGDRGEKAGGQDEAQLGKQETRITFHTSRLSYIMPPSVGSDQWPKRHSSLLLVLLCAGGGGRATNNLPDHPLTDPPMLISRSGRGAGPPC